MCPWEYSHVSVYAHRMCQSRDTIQPLGAAGFSLLLYLPATGSAQASAKPCTPPACHHPAAGGVSVLLGVVTQVCGQCLHVDTCVCPSVHRCTRFCRCAALCASVMAVSPMLSTQQDDAAGVLLVCTSPGQEHTLTHTGPALGLCHNHFVGCIRFDVDMVQIFPVFPVPGRVLPGPVCLCGYAFLCMPTRGRVHEAQHACRVLLPFFGVCPCPSVALCVLPAARASLQGPGLGSAVALCAAVGLEPGVCSGHREPCPALPCPCWGCSAGCEPRHPACLRLPREGRWRRYRTVPGVFSS